MRKSAMFFGVIGIAVLATAAWSADKKQDDGPGMTLGQQVGSLFGLIDRGERAPPPPAPPGMPAMGAPGPVRMPGRATTGGAPMNTTAKRTTPAPIGPKSVPGYVANDPSLPQPPQPTRIPQPQVGSTATVSDAAPIFTAARPQPTKSSTMTQDGMPRTSIVASSKAPLFTTPTAKPTVSAAAPTNNAASSTEANSASTGSSSRRRQAPALSEPSETSVAAEPELVPISTPIPVNQPDEFTPPKTTTPSTAAAAPNLSSPSSSGSEAFVPTLPKFTNESAGQTPNAIASSNQPATLPSLSTERPSGAIPVNKPDEYTQPIASQPVSSQPQVVVTPPTPAADLRPDVLSTHTSPELTIETLGPRKIAVGREARYRVMIRNRGGVEARDVIVVLDVPQHAEIAELHGTSGSSTSADEFATGKPLTWQIDSVPAKSQEELTLVLIPRRSEAFELGVRYTSSTPTARATVEVQEPKLALTVTGPSEVTFGEQRLYKLTVSNPGNGLAENVVLQLMPLSPGDGEPLNHVVGNLRAGESNAIEVELTARQAGTLRIRTAATAEGNLRAEAAADVVVRRASLEVVAAAPRMLFAGVPGTYEVRVRNTGDDAARNVRLTVDLPSAAKLLSSTPSVQPNAAGGPLTWTFDRIAPGSEQVCQLKCAWDQTGRQQITVVAVGDGDLRKTTVAATDVQAVADLALDVIDTPGPVPVGQAVTYEIRVKNRGLKSAEGVDVVAYFSEGIEPEKAEGHGFEIQPGMIIFKTLPTVGAGQERVLKVTARAQAAGNHRLRVELQSAAPQTQLSHEDATFFYADEGSLGAATSSPSQVRPTASTQLLGPTAAPKPLVPTASPIPTSLRKNGLR